MLPSGARVGFYDDRLRRRFLREKELEDRFPHALANGEFHMYLQPKVALPERRIVGAEALVRWISPEGMLCPNEFVPLFERDGVIAELDFYMFCQVCALLKRWERGGEAAFLRFSQRLALELRRFGFLRALRAPYRREPGSGSLPGIRVHRVRRVRSHRRDQQVIRRIHALGARCSMDDFGSSYSSLNMLRSLEVDIIKLDQGFFRGDTDMDKARSIVNGIVGIARDMRIETVAEGIEDMGQVDFLESVGCNVVQGYVFGKPMPADEFQDFKLDDTMRGNGDRGESVEESR